MAIRNLIVDAIADDAITGEKISGFSTATTGFILAKTSSGASWQAAADPNPTMGGDLSGLASNAQIVANAITANEISAGAVGSSEIADDAVTSNKIPTGAITTAKIASTINLSSKTITFPANSIGVTELNVSAGTAGQALTIDGGGALGFVDVTSDPTMGGDLTGLASNAQIAANAIGPTEIADQAITETKIHSSVNLGGPSVGTNSLIRTNSQDVNEDVTISATTNGLSAGPVEVLSGWTVTVDGNWTVI
jgi:hypothetical protein